MAASGAPGVFVAFNRKVILGTRAVKVRTTGFDAFESVNGPYAATVDSTGLCLHKDVIPPLTGPFRPEQRLCGDVVLVKLTPVSYTHLLLCTQISKHFALNCEFIISDIILKFNIFVNVFY